MTPFADHRTVSRLRRRARAVAYVVLAALLSAHCSQLPTASFPPGGNPRVLFVGNSLTFTNNLPAMYTILARSMGNDSLSVASIAYANFALEDHWSEGSARRVMTETPWNFVILQQGSSALVASQQNLRTWTERFAPVIRVAGAEPVLYMVWPTREEQDNFPDVLSSYRAATQAVSGIFAPAGDAWTAFGDRTTMYGSDGLHPSVIGTYQAALVLLERTLGIRPLSLAPVIPGAVVDSVLVRSLQQAAQTALDRNPARPQ